jgi:hypothetical protein
MQKSEDNPMHCGARTRSGAPCQSRGMKNGRCRIHGGTSPGAPLGPKNGNYKHGFWTKEQIELRKNASALLKSLRANI